ncbi:hypothetical protein EC991_003604 [Linnemannia zychae]|nr:hypothetical protein EC991_003604 [Linnemannia zychae]
MGCRSLWRLLSTKHCKPVERYPRNQPFIIGAKGNKYRFDIQGSIFPTIRYAYSNCSSREDAHKIVLQRIEQLATSPSDTVLYLDGAPAQEKLFAHQQRELARTKAPKEAEIKVSNFEDHARSGRRIRKQEFINIKKKLNASFRWNPQTRHDLAEFLRHARWTVVECETEADTKIANDNQPGDIFISADSDMLVYDKIQIVWRPISESRFLAYHIDEVTAALDMNRAQLTTLGIVSFNDYNRNIFSLGCQTNFSIIKSLSTKEGTNAMDLVKAYLADPRVLQKNKTEVNFDIPIRERYERALREYNRQKQNKELAKALDKRSSWENFVPRHQPSQRYNRYRTIDRPPSLQPHSKGNVSESTPIPHPRYFVKTRPRKLQHPRPKVMKKYTWKPWRKTPKPSSDKTTDSPAKTDFNSKKVTIALSSSQEPRSLDTMNKAQVLRGVAWEHPAACLKVGTLRGNANAVLKKDIVVADAVVNCVKGAVHQARKIMRQCQGLIGVFIERILASDIVMSSDRDRAFLDYIKSSDDPDDEQNMQQADLGDDDTNKDTQISFLKSFMTPSTTGAELVQYNSRLGGLCRNNKKVGVAEVVGMFILRLEELGIHKPVQLKSEINKASEYPAEVVVRSVSSHLAASIKRMCRHGSHELVEKLETARKKSGMIGCDLGVREGLSAVENFVALNRTAGSNRRIIPISTVKNGYVSFSELELVKLFWKSPVLKASILDIVKVDFPSCSALTDVIVWMRDREPGYYIKRFLCDVAPEGLSSRRKGQAGYRGAVKLMSIEQIKNHLRNIRSPDFVASAYDTKGYLLRGSILTNGVTMQLAAFKLKELQSVRYRRLPEDKLPPRLTSTVGGTDHFLTEIRNVIGSKEDVAFYWPDCPPEDIKILCLDLGQAFTAAASAIFPDFPSSNSPSKGKAPVKTATSTLITTVATSTTTCNSSAVTPMSVSSVIPPQGTHVFHNVAVNQKAIMQPTFKHRHWIEEQKKVVLSGAFKSVEQIESQLPALCGEGASVVAYLAELDKFQDQLENFYNGNDDIYISMHGTLSEQKIRNSRLSRTGCSEWWVVQSAASERTTIWLLSGLA